jgi:hypothetical protein
MEVSVCICREERRPMFRDFVCTHKRCKKKKKKKKKKEKKERNRKKGGYSTGTNNGNT